VAATIAADLLCWLRLLCLDPALADAEPKPCATGSSTPPPGSSAANANAKIKIPETWPWADELAAAFHAAFALTAPT
jgi:hypothetical protein